jgi:hypothetical protein
MCCYPGWGKTALAVHWGHRTRDRFPDGQLYLDLRGFAVDAPVRPVEALTHLLRSLGEPAEQIPADVQTAAGRYRSLLVDRQVLVVLDNAVSADQVRPLLPGSSGCLVLVTSRNRLTGLLARDGAGSLALDVLSPDEAYTLLATILGPDRAAAEPAATAELARIWPTCHWRCGWPPPTSPVTRGRASPATSPRCATATA